MKKSVTIFRTSSLKCPQTSWGRKSVIEVPWEIGFTPLQKLARFTKELKKSFAQFSFDINGDFETDCFSDSCRVHRPAVQPCNLLRKIRAFDSRLKNSLLIHLDFTKIFLLQSRCSNCRTGNLKIQRLPDIIIAASRSYSVFDCWTLQGDVM